jgi:hypothetical protein
LADGAFVNHFDAGTVKRDNQLHQRIDIASDNVLAGFHALNRWHRKPRKLGKLALVDAEQHPGSPQLSRCDHRPPRSGESFLNISYNLISIFHTSLFGGRSDIPARFGSGAAEIERD